MWSNFSHDVHDFRPNRYAKLDAIDEKPEFVGFVSAKVSSKYGTITGRPWPVDR